MDVAGLLADARRKTIAFSGFPVFEGAVLYVNQGVSDDGDGQRAVIAEIPGYSDAGRTLGP